MKTNTTMNKTVVGLFLVLALTFQNGNSQMVSATFSLVTSGSHGITRAGGQLSDAQSVSICPLVCLGIDECTHFLWDTDSQTCHFGLKDEVNPPESAPAPALVYQRLLCLAGYLLRYAGTTPMCVVYKLLRIPKAEAVNVCAGLQGHLVRVDTQEKLDAVVDLSNEFNATIGWIMVDGSDEAQEGQWVWSNGDPYTTEARNLFKHPEPEGGNAQNIAVINRDLRRLADMGNDATAPYVCESSVL